VIAAMLVAAGAFAPAERRGSTAPLIVTRHFAPADRLSRRYQYVPFDVPAAVGTLRIAYQYDRANGQNVVDLGLFEPGSLDLGTRAFRGYSGGSKSVITIGAGEATPGYRAGPLPPGRWHVLLGLYKVDEAGVDVTLTIEMHTEGAVGTPSARPHQLGPMPALRASSTEGARWFTGALHTHTLHSDGTVTPAELMALVREARFDFVAITDHNNTTHADDSALRDENRPLRIVGEEVTTPGGHANVWGLKPGDWVDFRVRPEDKRIGELVAAARGLGGLVSVNHPASVCAGCGWDHDFVEGIEAIEISNGRHGEVENAVAIWDRLLITGRKITGVGSSDWHTAPNAIDEANVRVFADSLTERDLLSAIRHGRVIVMGGAGDETPEVLVRTGSKSASSGETLSVAAASPITVQVSAPGLEGGARTLVVVTNAKRAAPVRLDERGRITIEQLATHGYIRFELYRGDGRLFAATNPVYLVRP
jgi:predicted metal-dependent phosphoesterase TrpH